MILRRVLGIWVISWVAFCELAFLLDLFGLSYPRPIAVWGIVVVGPLLALAVFMPRVRFPLEDEEGNRWIFFGLLTFGAFGSAYFITGHLLPPDRVNHLPGMVLSWLPVVPAFSLLYVAVHPFNLLPWFLLRSPDDMRRMALAMLMMLTVCVLFWVAWPVATVRPVPPEMGGSLGPWVLGLIYQLDPSANCFPSAHCAVAMCVAWSLWKTHKGMGLWAMITCAAIALSTLFTHQHYFLDVVAGLGLGTVCWFASEPVLKFIQSRALSPA